MTLLLLVFCAMTPKGIGLLQAPYGSPYLFPQHNVHWYCIQQEARPSIKSIFVVGFFMVFSVCCAMTPEGIGLLQATYR